MAIELESLGQLIVGISRKRIQPVTSRGYARSVLDGRTVRVAEKQPHAIRFNRTNSQRGHSFHGLIRFSQDRTAGELKARQRSYAFAQFAGGCDRKQLSHAAAISIFVAR